MGHAVKNLQDAGLSKDSQKCVSFTETPLEHVSLLLEKIEGRKCSFEPYGIAITKKQARKAGANPVWYIDITPGHDWLTKPINSLIKKAIKTEDFDNSYIFKLTPFIEQMGKGTTIRGKPYRKEFWWEREWRSNKNFDLPANCIILCPEDEIADFKKIVNNLNINLKIKFVDPFWSLEQIIARIAGFSADDAGPF